jgi:seryl-tRNA synthetase
MNVAVRSNGTNIPANPKASLDSLATALFRPMGVQGVRARTGVYEEIVERLAAFISRQREPDTEIFRFPPVMSRRDIERHGYLKSFPNLLGCVCALHGNETDIRAAAARHETGGEWTASLSPADLVLAPAACYPVYPIAANRGPVPAAGLRFDVACDCFRHEPSEEIDRFQSFRMREYVCIGSPDQVLAFRERWTANVKTMAEKLGLPYQIAPASDPFFGRAGQMMAVSQVQMSLKFEVLIPVRSAEQPTACMSLNYHREHFGEIWGLHHQSGAVCHTACTAFGMDRLTVALFRTHGLDVGQWPATVRNALAL